MTLEPLINSAMPITQHSVAGVMATLVGAAQLWLTKGTVLHRWLGYFWAGLIVFVALTGFLFLKRKLLHHSTIFPNRCQVWCL